MSIWQAFDRFENTHTHTHKRAWMHATTRTLMAATCLCITVRIFTFRSCLEYNLIGCFQSRHLSCTTVSHCNNLLGMLDEDNQCVDLFEGEIRLEPCLSQLASEPTILDAAPWRLTEARLGAVDPRHTALQGCSHSPAPLCIYVSSSVSH